MKKLGVKSVLSEIVPDLDPSKRANLTNSVLRERPKFKSFGLPALDATDIRNANFVASTRANSLSGTWKDNVSPSRLGYTHDFETMIETTAYRNHIKNYEFETRKVFERETENIPLTLQTYLMTTLHSNPLTQSTDSLKHEERHEPEVNTDPQPSSSYFSETSSSESRAKKKKRKKKKKRCKHRKDDSSYPSLSDDYDSSDGSHYRRKRRKNKKHRKKYPIKKCATLTAKFLTTAYKSKIIRFKMDEDPLQRRIYFLTFVE